MKERKYLFEAGLDAFISYKTIVPVEGLSELADFDDHSYHIYAILALDQYYFDGSNTRVTNKGFDATLFSIDENGQKTEFHCPVIPLTEEGNLKESDIDLKIIYPGNSLTLEIKDKVYIKEHPNEDTKMNISAQILYRLVATAITEKEEYEVLYIGQAFGKERGRERHLIGLNLIQHFKKF